MSAKLNNKYGCIEIDKQVISQVVYRAAMESYGLVGFSQKIKGIVAILIPYCIITNNSISIVLSSNSITLTPFAILQTT